ncbi:hypothetical protein JG687_00010423 [Phytophthora cactorum]|uniref:Tc1-like transposase DDE domain-containing protein n=1 Tax=Phytophthora cactorum TaxID=29920 RepID=A0A8T1UA16_9STRA|nr:hypothetical protein JG687_00010423 [Phytophthora cactorum]
MKLCIALKKQHGPCRIHMDGASYHKNISNKNPTMNSNRAEMHRWLTERGASFSVKETKSDLMLWITLPKEKPKYKDQLIASLHGHFLLNMPPYHPELQPIELIWAMVKGRIARDPPKNGNDAVEKVLDQLGEITRHNWIDVYRHVQGHDKYVCTTSPRRR